MMVDVSDEDERLLQAFTLILPEARGLVLQRVQIAACFAVALRGGMPTMKIEGKSPEQVTRAFLMRCIPNIPSGYRDDWGFEDAYGGHAAPLLEGRCIDLVLGSADQDALAAEGLAEDLTDFAIAIANDFCAPDFARDGFVSGGEVHGFIEEWREAFEHALVRAAVKVAG